MDAGGWIFIGAVCLAPLPLVTMLLREISLSFRRPGSGHHLRDFDQKESSRLCCRA